MMAGASAPPSMITGADDISDIGAERATDATRDKRTVLEFILFLDMDARFGRHLKNSLRSGVHSDDIMSLEQFHLCLNIRVEFKASFFISKPNNHIKLSNTKNVKDRIKDSYGSSVFAPFK